MGEGIWTPLNTIIGPNLEDLPMESVRIFYTPPEPEVPPTGSDSSGSGGGSTTPPVAAVVKEYTYEAGGRFEEFIDVDVKSDGVFLSSQGFEGIFEIVIRYTDISDFTYHKVFKWTDVPEGYQYQLYEYTPPPRIEENFPITIKAHLSTGIIESKVYQVRVRTNLERNTRMLQKKIKANARNGKTR